MALLDELVPPLLKAVQADLSTRDSAVGLAELSGFALLSGIASELLMWDSGPEPHALDSMSADAERSYEVAMRALRRRKAQS
ncbi:hypothetical protein [Nocardia sp. NPDC005745]|uniref:hypothetical protein n=1 Tax=Nocardia sp. NPDC005745 TaxID=3157061 RepID=UPI0033DE43A4